MSEENVEIVREAVDAFNRRDLGLARGLGNLPFRRGGDPRKAVVAELCPVLFLRVGAAPLLVGISGPLGAALWRLFRFSS
jgi:hypothetical protein